MFDATTWAAISAIAAAVAAGISLISVIIQTRQQRKIKELSLQPYLTYSRSYTDSIEMPIDDTRGYPVHICLTNVGNGVANILAINSSEAKTPRCDLCTSFVVGKDHEATVAIFLPNNHGIYQLKYTFYYWDIEGYSYSTSLHIRIDLIEANERRIQNTHLDIGIIMQNTKRTVRKLSKPETPQFWTGLTCGDGVWIKAVPE